MKFSKIFGLSLLSLAFLAASFVGGVYAGENYTGGFLSLVKKEAQAAASPADFSLFWKVRNLLDEKFIDASKVEEEDKLWGAIQGLASSYGDPYTVFLPPEESKSFETEISGNFEGVGMEVGIQDGNLTVVTPLKGSPAEKAGVKAGDRILTIDGESAIDLSVDEAVKKIRGPKGSKVTLTVLREGGTKPVSIEIMRDVVKIPTIDTEMRKDGIFVISLHNFSAISSSLFNDALNEFLKSKSNKLILDLRGNPGGYLSAAVEIASPFLSEGKVIVREDFGDKRPQYSYRSGKGAKLPNLGKLRMVVLIDKGSASASEIVAGALREQGVATLVGTETFGKGSVQELVPVTSDTSLKVTVAKWLTPNGKSISDGGLKPDVEVLLTEEDILNKNDKQLQKAVELLK